MIRAWELRDGTWDARVFDEVWNEDVYRLRLHTTNPIDFTRGPVLDIGANVGAFTLRALELGAPHVVAVEPDPDNVTQLLRNLTLCEARENVAVLRAAAYAESNETVHLSGHQTATFVDPHATGDTVAAHTISLIDLIDTSDEQWSCMKMDVEGGEFAAFSTVTLDALNRVDRIVMEFHGHGMPHLADEKLGGVGALVAKLMEWGTVETVGKPSVGGAIYGTRYGA